MSNKPLDTLPLPTPGVMAVLVSYHQALEQGTAGFILPDPRYQWQWYKGLMTVERMRNGLEGLDVYLNETAQHNWVQSNRNETFDTGPELSRLPDAAMVALFQELDQVFAGALQPIIVPAQQKPGAPLPR